MTFEKRNVEKLNCIPILVRHSEKSLSALFLLIYSPKIQSLLCGHTILYLLGIIINIYHLNSYLISFSSFFFLKKTFILHYSDNFI